jgi:hypothetical protein
MKYPAIENILPRSDNSQTKSLNSLSNLIDQAIDFGTNLQNWELQKDVKKDENIVPILFFRNILSVSDGISILIKKSSIDNSKSLIRVLLESIFSLEYLLQENTKERSLSYFVWNAHKDLKFLDQINPDTQSGKQMKSNITKDKFAKNINYNDFPKFLEEKRNAEELLKLPNYIPVENEYQRTNLKKKNPNWFTLYDGPLDFEQLASKVELNVLYQLHYRFYSKNIHSTDVHKGVVVPNDDGTGDIIQIRSWKGAISVSADTLNFILIAITTFQKKLLPEKHDDFLNWYGGFREEYLKLIKFSQKEL